jgi:hypothetical protein
VDLGWLYLRVAFRRGKQLAYHNVRIESDDVTTIATLGSFPEGARLLVGGTLWLRSGPSIVPTGPAEIVLLGPPLSLEQSETREPPDRTAEIKVAEYYQIRRGRRVRVSAHVKGLCRRAIA